MNDVEVVLIAIFWPLIIFLAALCITRQREPEELQPAQRSISGPDAGPQHRPTHSASSQVDATGTTVFANDNGTINVNSSIGQRVQNTLTERDAGLPRQIQRQPHPQTDRTSGNSTVQPRRAAPPISSSQTNMTDARANHEPSNRPMNAPPNHVPATNGNATTSLNAATQQPTVSTPSTHSVAFTNGHNSPISVHVSIAAGGIDAETVRILGELLATLPPRPDRGVESDGADDQTAGGGGSTPSELGGTPV